jgi:hypothetical protein
MEILDTSPTCVVQGALPVVYRLICQGTWFLTATHGIGAAGADRPAARFLLAEVDPAVAAAGGGDPGWAGEGGGLMKVATNASDPGRGPCEGLL